MLIEEDKLYTRSSGALRVFKALGNGWQLLYLFIIIPKFIPTTLSIQYHFKKPVQMVWKKRRMLVAGGES